MLSPQLDWQHADDDDDGIQLRQNLKANAMEHYRLVGEMAATMALQGRLLPQLFDNTAVYHFLDGTVDVEADFVDSMKEKRYIIRKVPLY